MPKRSGANTEAIQKIRAIASLAPLPTNWKYDEVLVQKRISEYFKVCEDNDILPTISNLAPAFRCDRRTIQRIISGETHSEPGVQALFQQTKAVLEAIMLDQGLTGDSNTIGCVFALKALHGYEDTPRAYNTPVIKQQPTLTIEELNAKYLTDVVIDTE